MSTVIVFEGPRVRRETLPPEVPAIHKELEQVLLGLEFDENAAVGRNGLNLINNVTVTPYENDKGEENKFDAQIKLALTHSPLSVNWGRFPQIVARAIDGDSKPVFATMNKFSSPLTNEVIFWVADLPNGRYKIEICDR